MLRMAESAAAMVAVHSLTETQPHHTPAGLCPHTMCRVAAAVVHMCHVVAGSVSEKQEPDMSELVSMADTRSVEESLVLVMPRRTDSVVIEVSLRVWAFAAATASSEHWSMTFLDWA